MRSFNTKRMIVILLVAMAFAAVVGAQQFPTYELRSIGGEQKDAVECASMNGLAALVATMNPDGSLAEGWTPKCLVPTK